MSILPHILVYLIGSFLFLFVFWKRLKEDYSSGLIFSAGLIFVISISVGFLLTLLLSSNLAESSVFYPSGLWFWGALIGFLGALGLAVRKYHLHTVETFEAAMLGAYIWLFLHYVVKLAVIPVLSFFVLGALFYFFEARYRRFGWYKSGRAGFSGLAVASIFFALRAIFAFINPSVFLQTGKLDFVPSAVATFLLLFSLYNLSER